MKKKELLEILGKWLAQHPDDTDYTAGISFLRGNGFDIVINAAGGAKS